MFNINKLKESSSEIKLLYVEDEEEIRQRMIGILGKFFTQIQIAKNGQEGLNAYKNDKPDLIITDIQMPLMDGLKMAEEICAIDRDQIIIVISAYNEIKYFSKAIKVGISGFILKPVEMDQLLDILYKNTLRVQHQKQNIIYKKHMEELVHEKTIEIERKIVTDDLTGLFNRVKLYINLQQSFKQTLLLLNIDNFGQINTTFGFEIGDKSLKIFADFLWNLKPANCMIYRLTSDEFVMLFQKSSLDEVSEYAKNIHEKIYNFIIDLPKGVRIQLTATLAIVEGNGEELLHKAQIALIEARQIRKNRVFVCRGEPLAAQRQKDNIYWMNRVRQSLVNETIVPFYQPIINNENGNIEKYECLARIVENDEIISPAKFIGPAKLVGLITQITRLMIRKSFEYFSGKNYEFSINITDEDLKEGFLIQYLEKIIRTVDIKPSNVVFEILEGISLTNSFSVIEQLNTLHDLGFKIAIDDFGAEQSNFSRLLDLKADFVKIDQKFIRNIHSDINSYKITQSIIFLAKNFETKTIAEFVHCKEVHDMVAELGIDYSQGYYLGEPKMFITEET
ncbi:MAG: EAL domain-containing protein [Deltaproteobacteria bacterium]|nr:EAL domain-containing protein [Deltaproteobacteria bacterium]